MEQRGEGCSVTGLLEVSERRRDTQVEGREEVLRVRKEILNGHILG